MARKRNPLKSSAQGWGDRLEAALAQNSETSADIVGKGEGLPCRSYFWEYYQSEVWPFGIESRPIEGRLDPG